MTNTFTFDLERDGMTYTLEVEYTFQKPSNDPLQDNDQDYRGWFDIENLFVIDENNNEVEDFKIRDEDILKEYFMYVQYEQALQEEEKYVSLQSMWTEEELDGYHRL